MAQIFCKLKFKGFEKEIYKINEKFDNNNYILMIILIYKNPSHAKKARKGIVRVSWAKFPTKNHPKRLERGHAACNG